MLTTDIEDMTISIQTAETTYNKKPSNEWFCWSPHATTTNKNFKVLGLKKNLY